MDVEIELLGVTVRMTHTWSLVHTVKAPCWRKGIETEAHVQLAEALGRGFSVSSKKARSRATDQTNWLYLWVSGFDIWLLTLILLGLDFFLCKMGQHYLRG